MENKLNDCNGLCQKMIPRIVFQCATIEPNVLGVDVNGIYSGAKQVKIELDVSRILEIVFSAIATSL